MISFAKISVHLESSARRSGLLLIVLLAAFLCPQTARTETLPPAQQLQLDILQGWQRQAQAGEIYLVNCDKVSVNSAFKLHICPVDKKEAGAALVAMKDVSPEEIPSLLQKLQAMTEQNLIEIASTVSSLQGKGGILPPNEQCASMRGTWRVQLSQDNGAKEGGYWLWQVGKAIGPDLSGGSGCELNLASYDDNGKQLLPTVGPFVLQLFQSSEGSGYLLNIGNTSQFANRMQHPPAYCTGDMTGFSLINQKECSLGGVLQAAGLFVGQSSLIVLHNGTFDTTSFKWQEFRQGQSTLIFTGTRRSF